MTPPSASSFRCSTRRSRSRGSSGPRRRRCRSCRSRSRWSSSTTGAPTRPSTMLARGRARAQPCCASSASGATSGRPPRSCRRHRPLARRRHRRRSTPTCRTTRRTSRAARQARRGLRRRLRLAQGPARTRRSRRKLAERASPTALIGRVSGVQLHDYGCTLKAYRRYVLEPYTLYGEMHRFIPIYASWTGARVTEMVVQPSPARRGPEQVRARRAPTR